MTAVDFERRPVRWGTHEVGGLSTVQLHYGGLLEHEPHGATPIHLVRCGGAYGGTPGTLLCGLDHHTLPIGFSVGGGSCKPALGDDDPATAPCAICIAVAARMSIGAGLLEIKGSVGGDRAQRALVAELERMDGLEVARNGSPASDEAGS